MSNKKNNKAFTLIEILIVVAIVGILSGIVVVSMSDSQEKARIAKSEAFSDSLRNSMLTSLVSEWKLDGDATDSWGSNNGTASGGPEYKSGAECVSGGCLSFDGTDDYVNCGNADLDVSNEMTFEAWVNFNGLDYSGATGTLNTISSKGHPDTSPGTPSSGWWFSYDNRNNQSSFNYTCFGNSNGGWSGGGNNFPYSYHFSNNKWYHICFTINSSSQGRLYIDGSQLGATRYFTDLVLANTTANLYISESVSHKFNGTIDTVRIYNQALTSSAIQQNYLAGLDSLLTKGLITNQEYTQRLLSYETN